MINVNSDLKFNSRYLVQVGLSGIYAPARQFPVILLPENLGCVINLVI